MNASDIRKMLFSNKASDRYEACELLRVSESITDEDAALLRAVAESDKKADIREAASDALALHRPLAAPVQAQVIPAPQVVAEQSSTNVQAASTAAYSPPAFTIPPMPSAPLNSPEYISALEKRVLVLEVELSRARGAPAQAPVRQATFATVTEQEIKTALVSPSFLTRAFAVWGHFFVAQLLIAIPIYFIIFLFALMAGS